MTVSVEIISGRAEKVIVVDSDAVREAASASPWVLLVREGRAERRAVKLGLRGAGATQIAEGLAAGDLVVPVSQPGIAEGQRVRPEAPRPAKKLVGNVPNFFQ
jgi:HlyD family secretion protein